MVLLLLLRLLVHEKEMNYGLGVHRIGWLIAHFTLTVSYTANKR